VSGMPLEALEGEIKARELQLKTLLLDLISNVGQVGLFAVDPPSVSAALAPF
jgi:hypothetical protein